MDHPPQVNELELQQVSLLGTPPAGPPPRLNLKESSSSKRLMDNHELRVRSGKILEFYEKWLELNIDFLIVASRPIVFKKVAGMELASQLETPLSTKLVSWLFEKHCDGVILLFCKDSLHLFCPKECAIFSNDEGIPITLSFYRISSDIGPICDDIILEKAGSQKIAIGVLLGEMLPGFVVTSVAKKIARGFTSDQV